jgi:hypothetical protein
MASTPAPADVPFVNTEPSPSPVLSAVSNATPTAVTLPAARREDAPGLGKRLLTGLLWGGVYGQWWTFWKGLSILIWSMGSIPEPRLILVLMAVFVVMYAIAGTVTGLVIAFTNGTRATGAIVGVVVGLALCGLEMLLNQNPFSLFNIFFFFVTGRFVGSGLAGRVWRLRPGEE